MSAAPALRSTPAGGFYHCSVKSVGRANGRSVVAAAAYRAGERLVDEKTGLIQDYQLRKGVEDAFIVAPADAPAWAQDRQRLWNEAEHAEPRANGRLATELELALPCELDATQRKALVADFARGIADRYGVAVDVAIHAPGKDGDHRNHHAHVLVTHRELGPEGFGEMSNARTVTKKIKGQFKEVAIYGIAANAGDVVALRQAWEQQVNQSYERAGLDIRVDHRSHAERGIQQEPTVHLGPEASQMERRGATSDLGDINREITRRNTGREELARLEAEEARLTAQIIDLQAEREKREAAKEQTPVAPEKQGTSDRAADVLQPKPEAARENEQPSPATERAPSRTAGEIRAAWSLTRTVGDLNEALATRGITLARVTAAEALASTRATAHGEYAELKPEPGSDSPVLRAGEVVAVDQHGSVYLLNERTTGDPRHEIAERLAKANHETLLTVTEAKDVMREAAQADHATHRQAEREQRQAERDKTRPPTSIEQKIIWADRLADEHNSFTALCDQAGVALVRVTARDVQALEALRADARLAVTTNDGKERVGHFAQVGKGELAAVTRQGDVLRLNQHHLAEIGQREGANLPSVTEARAAFAIDNEARKTVRQAIRTGRDEDRAAFIAAHAERMEKVEGRQELRDVTAKSKRAVHTLIDGMAKTRTAANAVGSLAAAVTNALGGLFEFFAVGQPKLNRQQAHDRQQAAGNVETHHAEAVAHDAAKVEAERAERISRADSEQQAPLAAPGYFRTVTRPADPAERRLQEQQHEQERERER